MGTTTVQGEHRPKRAPFKSLCIGCRRVTYVRAWRKDTLAQLFGLQKDELPLHAYWHAGLCADCGMGLWNALGDEQRAVIGDQQPVEVFISRAAFNPGLARAVDVLYRSVMHGSEVLSAEAEYASKVLRDYRRVVGQIVVNGHGSGGGDTQQQAGPAATKASRDARQAQQLIVAATVKSAQTGARVYAFPPPRADRPRDSSHDATGYGVMKPRPKKAKKEEGKKKDAVKRARREKRYG